MCCLIFSTVSLWVQCSGFDAYLQIPKAVYDFEVEIDGDTSNWWHVEVLHTIKLSRNSLQSLPDGLATVESLQVLDVSENELTCLPQNLSQLCNLKILDISANGYAVLTVVNFAHHAGPDCFTLR